VKKIPKQQIKGGRIYFGPQFVLVHGTWLHCFWAFDEAVHHGEGHCGVELFNLMAARKQREKG
jgi:hypothetical protein